MYHDTKQSDIRRNLRRHGRRVYVPDHHLQRAKRRLRPALW